MPRLGSLSLEVSASARVLRALAGRGEVPLAFPEGLRAMDALVAPAEDRLDEGGNPRVLVYAPAAHANRFQGLLYGTAADHGVGLVPLRDFAELDQLPLFAPFVCHLHWLAAVTSEARDAAAARRSIERFLASIDRLIDGPGARIVWTAHNTLPHDTRFPEEHGRLREELIRRAALIHFLTEQSIGDLAARFDLGDARTVAVPHPSYRGAYPDHVTHATARRTLGIDADATVLLGFGALQRYKGFDTLCAAFDRLAGDNMRLLIAGGPSDATLAGEIAAWANGRADVTLIIDKIADDDLQLVFRAADLALCPYRETLNSGVAALALSFGVPVVASALGAFVALEGEGVVTADPAGGADAFAVAVRSALADRERLVEATSRYGARHAPTAISRRFFEAIESLWPTP